MSLARSGDDCSLALEDAVTGEEVSHAEWGASLLVASRLEDAGPDGALSDRLAVAFSSPGLTARIAEICTARFESPDQIMFVDIETTGLTYTPLFLIGTMTWDPAGFEVRQYFARSFAEEASVIALFVDACRKKNLFVTFNGKSFDIPYIRKRATEHGIGYVPELGHFDLLYECRRIWGGVLPNCELQTLERHVCGRTRETDIPGHLIPEAYYEFVRTQDAWQIAEIVKHNVLDLATLAELMVRLPRA